MTAPILATALDGLQFTLAAPYAAGSGLLALKSAAGQPAPGAAILARIAAEGAPAVSPSAPVLAVLVPAAAINQFGNVTSWAGCVVFTATVLSGDDLAAVATYPGTDSGFATGDTVLFGTLAKFFNDLNAAVMSLAASYLTVVNANPPAAGPVYRGVVCCVRKDGFRDEFFRCVYTASTAYEWEMF
jgi:hypothetical protein